ncbi:MAG: DNA-3-methyladenine glycosylase [Candidatus Pacebacteria bacterium]|nr:DNA-3-methyladenine glycosylase [Candidatus Paceibacterota bacterium]
MERVLSEKFFRSRNTLKIAKSLLGKFLVVRPFADTRDKQSRHKLRKIGRQNKAYMITEVEAYDGFKDKASHAHRGKTERNKIMFGEAGHWYVYFTYGIHWLLNIVTGPENYPAAILIRGVEGYNGPAKLTKALKIDKRLNGKSADKKSGLWIENRGVKIKKIKSAARIGVLYAGPVWSKKKYRFYI